ncbi:hypothetical protein BU17DRAFT_61175 [Hysterangium stoloniferum]|nr:hypothetical protein BU17DRAFT_61175 [Hysterangium stoloniferum]
MFCNATLFTAALALLAVANPGIVQQIQLKYTIMKVSKSLNQLKRVAYYDPDTHLSSCNPVVVENIYRHRDQDDLEQGGKNQKHWRQRTGERCTKKVALLYRIIPPFRWQETVIMQMMAEERRALVISSIGITGGHTS